MSTNNLSAGPACPDEATLERFLRDEAPRAEAETLDAHVSGCPACQGRLERLVGGLPRTVAFAAGPSGDPADDAPPQLPGYAPMTKIDAGGMGVVWRIRDLQFRRNLAVKVMKTRAARDPALVRRFVAEAQVCGQLAHPFIVPVHGMGRLPDGRPYYTMKLVEGKTLAALLAEEPSAAGRPVLAIFAEVCQAMAFAHSQGIIHRDLKPENVMVGAHGEVQVMDWGLAKVLTDLQPSPGAALEALPEDDSVRTRAGTVLGTVAYMPPEQASGRVGAVDRRADVFGLGAILCQILTGAPPYVAPTTEAVRALAVAANLDAARARLRGCGADPELIRLAERCLAAAPADRPTDASAVAAVVAAHVTGVQERLQQERLERERHELRAAEEQARRKLWTGLAAAVASALLVLAVSLVVVNRLRTEEQAAKDEARRRAEETRAIMDELSSAVIDDWLTHQPQLSPEQKVFLQKGLAHYEKFTRATGETAEGRAALARAYRRVGVIRLQLGLLAEAEEALSEAVRLFDGLAEAPPEAAEALRTLAVVLAERGDHRRAIPLATAALRRMTDKDDLKIRASRAKLLATLGGLHADIREADEAHACYREALDLLTALTAASTAPEPRLDLASVHRRRAVLLDDQQRRDEAITAYRDSISVLKELTAAHPLAAEYRLHLAGSYTSLGATLCRRKRLAEAQTSLEDGLSLLKPLAAEFRAVPRYRQDLAVGYNNLALVLEDMGRVDESVAATRRAIELREELVHDHRDSLDYVVTLGGTYGNLAALLKDQGRPAEALPWYEKAVALLEPALRRESRHRNTRSFLRNMYAGRAQALARLGRHDEAVADGDRALALDDGRRRLLLQGRQALSLKEYARAVAAAREQAAVEGTNAETLYECARVCALAATADATGRDRHAAAAVELLGRAVANGFENGPRKDMRTDKDFDVLRGRDDFRALERP